MPRHQSMQGQPDSDQLQSLQLIQRAYSAKGLIQNLQSMTLVCLPKCTDMACTRDQVKICQRSQGPDVAGRSSRNYVRLQTHDHNLHQGRILDVSEVTQVLGLSSEVSKNWEKRAPERIICGGDLSNSDITSVNGVLEHGTAFVSHGEERKAWSCTLCNYSTYSHWCLNRHMRTHTGERPYVCDFCSRRFAQKIHLDKHRRTHTGEKPFRCNICGATFIVRGSWVNHMYRHSCGK